MDLSIDQNVPSNEQPIKKREYSNELYNPDYKGEPVDPELINGPFEKRGCTDIICCVIFILFWVGQVYIAMEGFKQGNPKLLGIPFDPDGNYLLKN